MNYFQIFFYKTSGDLFSLITKKSPKTPRKLFPEWFGDSTYFFWGILLRTAWGNFPKNHGDFSSEFQEILPNSPEKFSIEFLEYSPQNSWGISHREILLIISTDFFSEILENVPLILWGIPFRIPKEFFRELLWYSPKNSQGILYRMPGEFFSEFLRNSTHNNSSKISSETLSKTSWKFFTVLLENSFQYSWGFFPRVTGDFFSEPQKEFFQKSWRFIFFQENYPQKSWEILFRIPEEFS